MSPMPLGILAAAAGGVLQYFLARPEVGTINDVAFDAENNFLLGGNDVTLTKIDPNLQTVWAKDIPQSTLGLDIDSSGYIYTARGNDITKWDSAGTLVWQKIVNTNSASFQDLKIDSSDSIYVGGDADEGSQGDRNVAVWKFDTDGVLQWSREGGRGTQDGADGVRIDSSGNVHIAGHYRLTSGYTCYYGQLSPTGSLNAGRNFARNANMFFYDVALDSNDNAYVVGYMPDNNEKMFIVKMNNFGSIQWQRQLDGNGSRFYGIGIDQNDNIYCAGSNGYIVQYDTSGNVVWQRSLSAGTATVFNRIRIDNNGDLVIVGYARDALNVNKPFMAKLPPDGSLTGSYDLEGQTWNYAVSTLTTSTTNVGNNSFPLNWQTTSPTVSNNAFSVTSPTVTSPFVQI